LKTMRALYEDKRRVISTGMARLKTAREAVRGGATSKGGRGKGGERRVGKGREGKGRELPPSAPSKTKYGL